MSPRKKAIENKQITYFGGKNCKHCNGGERYTSSGNCVPCVKINVGKKVESGYYAKRYEDKKEEILSKQKEYYSKNADAKKEKSKIWASKNKEKVSFYKMSNKAMRRAKTSVGISGIDLMSWSINQDKICSYCNNECESDFHIDHIVPLSRGGDHKIDNLTIACQTCNLRKSNKDAEEFRELIQKELGVLK